MSKRVATFVALGVVAAGVTMVNPTAALADGADRTVCWTNESGQRGGCGYLDTNGEWVHVTDSAADGWGTRAQIQVYSGGLWKDHSSNCFDDTSTGTPETRCNYSVADGTTIRLHVWASNGSATKAHVYTPVTTA